MIRNSPLRGKYDEAIDSESAYEILAERKNIDQASAQEIGEAGGLGGWLGSLFGINAPGTAGTQKTPGRTRMSVPEIAARSAATSVARSIGNEIGKAITGKPSRGGRSVTDVAIQSATSSAVRALVRNVLGGLTKGGR